MSAATSDPKAIFFAALDQPSSAERSRYLDAACDGDAELRSRVEQLLAAHDQAGQFLGGSGATLDLSGPELASRQIGPYKLLQQIGEGGMGVVYMAEQTEPIARRVALKIIKPGMDSRQVIARFEAERQALAMMDHVNIARVLDAGTTQAGRPYFVMELVHGVPITKYCDDNRLTPRQRLELFVPVCQAIQHAHQKGIIHRDIKPTNVMVTLYDGQPVPKVIDFGVAKATEQKLTERTLFTQYGTLVGTLEYMSPEQAEMSALGADTRSDIYSLGVLLYELLTGSTPLTHKRIKETAYAEVLRMIKEEEPPKPSTRLSETGQALASISAQRHTEPAKLSKQVRGELDWIVMKTLEKDRNRRYETANGFAADVQRYLDDEPVQACPPSPAYKLRKFARRNRVVLSTTVLVLTVLVVGTFISTWQAFRATGAERLAETRLEAETKARSDAEAARAEEAKQRAVADRRQIDADEQRADAVSQGQKAEVARKEAIANLQKAREAGQEFFTRVSENRLLDEPGLRPLRQDLLEAGVAYYEGLATGKSGDPQVQADLIASRLRLVQIYFHMRSRDQHIRALEKGIEAVEEFLRVHPDATSEHLKLAGFFHGGRGIGAHEQPFSDRDRALQVYEQATSLWEKLVERYPTATGFQSDLSKFYDLQANLQFEMGQRDDALRMRQKVREIREQIVRANPGVYEHVAELGHAYQALALLLERSDPEAAEALYRHSLTIQKDAPDIVTYQDFRASHQSNVGKFLVGRNRPEEAIPLLQESLGIWEKLAEKFPHASDLRTKAEDGRQILARAYLRLSDRLSASGQSHEAEKAYRQALDIFERAIELRPNDGSALNYLAWMLASSPDPKFRDAGRALELAKKVVELDPKNGDYVNTLGIAHYRVGDWNAAIDALKKSDEVLKWEQFSFNAFFLAMAHWQLDEKDEARKWYDKAVAWMEKNKPDNEELRRLKAEAEELIEQEETAWKNKH